MSELAEWLREQNEARRATAVQHITLMWEVQFENGRSEEHDAMATMWLAGYDPEFVRDQCGAVSSLITEYELHASHVSLGPDVAARMDVALYALKFLALPYADRDGYREEWRP